MRIYGGWAALACVGFAVLAQTPGRFAHIFIFAHCVKAVVRDLGKTKSGKQKAAKEARKIVEMKGKQIKDELSLAMIQLFTKLLDEDSVEASTIDDVIQGPN